MAEYLTLDLNSVSGKGDIKVEIRAESVSVPFARFPYRVPFFMPRGQAYYWTREWQEGEAEADEELRRGEARTFDDVEDALRWLNSPED